MYQAEYNGIVATPSLWTALGATEAYAYTNAHGPVVFARYGHDDYVSAQYALELLTRARAELEHEASKRSRPEPITGDTIVTRAVVLRGRDRSARALTQLGDGLLRLANSGVGIRGSLHAEIVHVARQLASEVTSA